MVFRPHSSIDSHGNSAEKALHVWKISLYAIAGNEWVVGRPPNPRYFVRSWRKSSLKFIFHRLRRQFRETIQTVKLDQFKTRRVRFFSIHIITEKSLAFSVGNLDKILALDLGINQRNFCVSF